MVGGKLKHYHKLMGVPLPRKIFFDKNEWIQYLGDQNIVTKGYSEKVLGGLVLGSNLWNGSVIFINVEAHAPALPFNDKNHLHDYLLTNTIIHETMHTKYPKLKHGGTYESYCTQIHKGIYPPSCSKLARFINAFR